jgi:hypothetical protein
MPLFPKRAPELVPTAPTAPEAPPDDHTAELEALRRRFDAIDAEKAVDAEIKRVNRLSYADLAAELGRAQDERMGLPEKWVATAQARCESLLSATGWRFAKNTNAPADTTAWLEWTAKRCDALERYRDAVAAQAATADRSHPYSVGMDELRRFRVEQDTRKAVKAAEATCRALGLTR